MKPTTEVWLGIFAVITVWTALTGGALLPMSLMFVVAACTVHASTRDRVMSWLVGLFSYGFLRGCVLILGGAVMIQFLPLEMALFAAADILAYVEIAAAVALIAANVRLRAVATIAARRIQGILTRVVRRAGRAFRSARRPLQRPASTDGPDRWGPSPAALSWG